MPLLILLALSALVYFFVGRVTRRPLTAMISAIAAFFIIPLAIDQMKMIVSPDPNL